MTDNPTPNSATQPTPETNPVPAQQANTAPTPASTPATTPAPTTRPALHRRVLRHLPAILFLATAGILTHYYFTFSEENTAIIHRVYHNFYKQLTPSMARPTMSTIFNQWENQSLEPYHQHILQAALTRYRMQPQAPTAFTRLVDDYARGPWNSDIASKIRPVLTHIDDRWTSARIAATQPPGEPINSQFNEVPGAGFGMNFLSGHTTGHIGSLIQIDFTLPPGSPPVTQAEASWTTLRQPDVSAYRFRLCPVQPVQPSAATGPVYRLTLDMKSDIQWLNPDTIPQWIHIRGAGLENAAPIAYHYGDTPLPTVTPAPETP